MNQEFKKIITKNESQTTKHDLKYTFPDQKFVFLKKSKIPSHINKN